MKFLLHIIVVLICTTPLFSQSRFEKETFEDAEYFFATEAYRDALPLYLQLLKRNYRDNANILYRVGICYLNLPGEKTQAIEYLEKSSQKASSSYKKSSLKEKHAPLDSWLYLGNAYRVNFQLDKAVEAYENYLRVSTKISNLERDWVQIQIDACKRAKDTIKNPVTVSFIPLVRPFGTKNNESNPVVTHDERMVVYTVQQKFYNAVYWVQKKERQLGHAGPA